MNGELWLADDGTVELRSHRPESYLRDCLDVAYDPKAESPEYDKAVGEIAEILFPIADRVVATHVENPRSASPEEIIAAGARTGASVIAEADFGRAMKQGFQLALQNQSGLLVITGSIYTVGAASAWLRS